MLIRAEDWENGKVKLADEVFEARYMYPRDEKDEILEMAGIRRNKLMAFCGEKTGTLLHPEFTDILE